MPAFGYSDITEVRFKSDSSVCFNRLSHVHSQIQWWLWKVNWKRADVTSRCLCESWYTSARWEGLRKVTNPIKLNNRESDVLTLQEPWFPFTLILIIINSFSSFSSSPPPPPSSPTSPSSTPSSSPSPPPPPHPSPRNQTAPSLVIGKS